MRPTVTLTRLSVLFKTGWFPPFPTHRLSLQGPLFPKASVLWQTDIRSSTAVPFLCRLCIWIFLQLLLLSHTSWIKSTCVRALLEGIQSLRPFKSYGGSRWGHERSSLGCGPQMSTEMLPRSHQPEWPQSLPSHHLQNTIRPKTRGTHPLNNRPLQSLLPSQILKPSSVFPWPSLRGRWEDRTTPPPSPFEMGSRSTRCVSSRRVLEESAAHWEHRGVPDYARNMRVLWSTSR